MREGELYQKREQDELKRYCVQIPATCLFWIIFNNVNELCILILSHPEAQVP